MITNETVLKAIESYEQQLVVLHKISGLIPVITLFGGITPAYKVIKEEIKSLEGHRDLLYKLLSTNTAAPE